MKTKNNNPTYKFKTELIFKNYVTFMEDKILLSQETPKEVAQFLYIIMPSDVKIVYNLNNAICKCGEDLH